MTYLNTIHRKNNQYQEDRKLIPQIKYLISKQQSIISYFDVHDSNSGSACPQNTIIINPMVTNYLSHEDEKISRLFHLKLNKRHSFPYPVHCESGNFLKLYVSDLSLCQNLIFPYF